MALVMLMTDVKFLMTTMGTSTKMSPKELVRKGMHILLRSD